MRRISSNPSDADPVVVLSCRCNHLVSARLATPRSRAFSLVELLVSMTILAVIMMMATGVIHQTQKTWTQTSASVEQFREARSAFETITSNLSQATLNSYQSYRYNHGATPTIPSNKTEAPIDYLRHSELQFVTGQASILLGGEPGNVAGSHAIFFQAPLGITNESQYRSLTQLLSSCGYFIMYGDDSAYRPVHVAQSRTRFRLMEFRPPAEKNAVYTAAAGQWFASALSQTIGATDTAASPASTRPAAENIVALIISPCVSPRNLPDTNTQPSYIAPNYHYDSSEVANNTLDSPQGTQHLLPPEIHVTLVAIDENSARRLAEKYPDAQPQLIAGSAFKKVSDYASDLATLEETLVSEKLVYRVFTAVVALRNARWQTSQEPQMLQTSSN